MTQAVQFDEATHTYTDRDGINIPSVTQVLQCAGLVDYSGIDPEVLNRKAWIGTQAHRATQFLDEGDLDMDSVHETVKPYVQAWENFKNESGFKPLVGEAERPRIVMINGMRYAMTADVTGTINGKQFVIEKKCASQEEVWWKVQLAAYEQGIRSEDKIHRMRMAVKLGPDASYRAFNYGDVLDYQMFGWALGIEWWKRSNRK